jgi:hypothetical protein
MRQEPMISLVEFCHNWLMRVAFSFLLVATLLSAGAAWSEEANLVITRKGGEVIKKIPEETSSLFGRPLRKTRDRLHAKHGDDFIFFYSIDVEDGDEVKGTYVLPKAISLRITMYEIAQDGADAKKLRVIGSKYYHGGETAEFLTTVDMKTHDHAHLITAEETKDVNELNQHLTYMNEQEGGEIIVDGVSTNWSFSTIKFKLAGYDPAQDKNTKFTRDGDWLVERLINPQWVSSIRLE